MEPKSAECLQGPVHLAMSIKEPLKIRLLSKGNHPNLVGLVGFCEETGSKDAKNIGLRIRRGGRNLTWRHLVNIAIGAAKGIAHSHDGIKPSIIHRDIKPSNILIGERFEAKVSGFGHVKMGPIEDQSHVSSQNLLKMQ
ncbi:hypothetical protein V6N11_076507 [Hibiscus sabdariffa]|uniref:Protein kinase domain-containing protein n=1 Tax=Hibiscus sabdariffa TaxID=183260 RepID=A0ABR2Q6I7_9ROSI